MKQHTIFQLFYFDEYLAWSSEVKERWYRSAQISIAYLELCYLGQSEHGRTARTLKDGRDI